MRNTSADGLSVTTTNDVNGDGVVDETTTDVTVLNADGSKTETVTTTYASGAQKSQIVTATSANGKNVTTTHTINGYGKITDTLTIAADGTKTEEVAHYNSSNSLWTRDVTTTSADGLRIEVDHYNSSNSYTGADITLVTAGAYGSYEVVSLDPNRYNSASNGNEFVHNIDANGVDHVSNDQCRSSSNGYLAWTTVLSLAQEAEEQASVARLYSTI